MLPNFLIIGAQKAATTWLAKCISGHPDLFLTPIKETHFFNHEFDRGLAWYERHFKAWSGQPLVGEATPGYLSYPQTPQRIKEVLGNELKFIISLRHPVNRAYSAYWHYVSRGDIPADIDFRTAFREGESYNLTRLGLYERGAYYTHLSRYLEYFPRENFLIFIYEEAMPTGPQLVSRCLDFLGAEPQFRSATLNERINNSRDLRMLHGQALALKESVANTVNLLPESMRQPILSVGRRAFEQLIFKRLPKKNSYVALTPELRQELLADFMPEIKQLENLLDRDLSLWYAPASS
jgi:hypothetical protein